MAINKNWQHGHFSLNQPILQISTLLVRVTYRKVSINLIPLDKNLNCLAEQNQPFKVSKKETRERSQVPKSKSMNSQFCKGTEASVRIVYHWKV